LRGGPHHRALLAAKLDSTRMLEEVTPPGVPLGVFLLKNR